MKWRETERNRESVWVKGKMQREREDEKEIWCAGKRQFHLALDKRRIITLL